MGAIIGKNPSTAGKDNNDATMHKDVLLSRAWGWCGVLKVNLSDLISTDPIELLKVSGSQRVSPFGLIDNVIDYLKEWDCSEIVCAWGTSTNKYLAQWFRERGENMRKRLIAADFSLYYLRLNSDGTPAHTLYLPSNVKPIPWVRKELDAHRNQEKKA